MAEWQLIIKIISMGMLVGIIMAISPPLLEALVKIYLMGHKLQKKDLITQ